MNNQMNNQKNNQTTYQIERFLRLQIAQLIRLIPFDILVQNSHIISYRNKQFIPIIFKNRNDYYIHLIKSLKNILRFLKSKKGKDLIRQLKLKKFKMRILITHSGFIIFQIKKDYTIYQIKRCY